MPADHTGSFTVSPDPLKPGHQIQLHKNLRTDKMQLRVTRNGGVNWQPVVVEPVNNNLGAYTIDLLASEDGENEVKVQEVLDWMSQNMPDFDAGQLRLLSRTAVELDALSLDYNQLSLESDTGRIRIGDTAFAKLSDISFATTSTPGIVTLGTPGEIIAGDPAKVATGEGVAAAIAALAAGGLAGDGVNFVVVDASADDVDTNGANLLAAYTAAKALTPNGAALSATNRGVLIIPPGVYELASIFTVNAQFVDVFGMGAMTKKPAVLLTNKTINVTANDVRVSGISVGSQSFRIGENGGGLQVYENCVGGTFSFTGEYTGTKGTFIGCVGGDESIGGWTPYGPSTFEATAINCDAGGGSLGANGLFWGVAIGCVGGTGSFGLGGVLSGKLYYCRLTVGTFETVSGAGQTRFCLNGVNVIDNQG